MMDYKNVWRLTDLFNQEVVQYADNPMDMFVDGELVVVTSKTLPHSVIVTFHNRELGEFAFGPHKNITVTIPELVSGNMYFKNNEYNAENCIAVKVLLCMLSQGGNKAEWMRSQSYSFYLDVESEHQWSIRDISVAGVMLSFNDMITVAGNFGFHHRSIPKVRTVAPFSRALIEYERAFGEFRIKPLVERLGFAGRVAAVVK